MKKLAAVAGAALLASGAIFLWIDGHPRVTAAPFELKSGIALDLPLGWPAPEQEYGIVSISAAPGDQYPWDLTIHDEGTDTKIEELIAELRKGYGELAGPVGEVRLRNGIVARSWIATQPMMEVSQDHRIYVFGAPDGHINWAMLPRPKSWRKARRYDAIFRGVLGSMRFKS